VCGVSLRNPESFCKDIGSIDSKFQKARSNGTSGMGSKSCQMYCSHGLKNNKHAQKCNAQTEKKM